MKAIKIDTTKYTKEQILDFAKYRGYQEVLQEEKQTPIEGTAEVITELVEVSNPQTPEAYIEEKAKEVMKTWFSELMIQNARQSAREQENEAIISIKEQVGQTIDIIEV